MSICLSVCPQETTRLPLDEFSWHFIFDYFPKICREYAHFFNPLTPELNPSAQRCLTRFLLGILLLEPRISLIYAWKTNKCNNHSFGLLIMYGISYMFRHYIAIFRERSLCLLRDAQLRSIR
jgi:hypothetical protein